MKRNILSFLFFTLLCFSSNAQNNVELQINHKLANADFGFEIGAKNNLDHDFNVTRLQYYISEISIIHDGGTETTIPDLFILVDAGEATTVNMGEFDINSAEAIHFHIGVGPDYNHLDPSLYPSDHPLAPVFPSMHWGWASGYRFIAMEGFGSSSFNQLYQLHGLGDANYFKTEVPIASEAANNQLIIELDADYTRALEEIEVNAGVIVHGENGAARKALQNFRDHVFSPAGNSTSTIDISEINSFDIYPNPSNGAVNMLINSSVNHHYDIAVFDILGRSVTQQKNIQSNTAAHLTLEQPGTYLVRLIRDGEALMTRKLTIQ